MRLSSSSVVIIIELYVLFQPAFGIMLAFAGSMGADDMLSSVSKRRDRSMGGRADQTLGDT